jgi:hypothetical protein
MMMLIHLFWAQLAELVPLPKLFVYEKQREAALTERMTLLKGKYEQSA